MYNVVQSFVNSSRKFVAIEYIKGKWISLQKKTIIQTVQNLVLYA